MGADFCAFVGGIASESFKCNSNHTGEGMEDGWRENDSALIRHLSAGVIDGWGREEGVFRWVVIF